MQEIQHALCLVLSRMHEGARTLTYHDIRKMWSSGSFPFKQFEVNRCLTDRFPTSWSVQRGHHFFLWKKVGPCHVFVTVLCDDDILCTLQMVPSCTNPEGVLSLNSFDGGVWAPVASDGQAGGSPTRVGDKGGSSSDFSHQGVGRLKDGAPPGPVMDAGNERGCLPFLSSRFGLGFFFKRKNSIPNQRHRNEVCSASSPSLLLRHI
jgi:hypothetical protein